MRSPVVALALVTFAGCGPMPGYSATNHPTFSPPLFEDYVQEIEAHADVSPVAKLPTSLQFTAPLSLPSSFFANPGLRLGRLDAEKVCLRTDSFGDKTTATADEVGKEQLEFLQQSNLYIRALDSLDAQKGKALRDVPTDAVKLDSFTILSDEIKDFDDRRRGEIVRRREVVIDLCAPAPKITDRTRFIAITTYETTEKKPDYESMQVATTDAQLEQIKARNKTIRLVNGTLTLIAITDGAVNLHP